MHRTWLSAHRSSGSLVLHRSEASFGVTPGQSIDPNWNFLLERIVLQWKPHQLPDYVQFEVTSYDDLNPVNGEVIGPTESIAGHFSFVVDQRNHQIIEVLPGPLSPSLVLSTLAHHVKRNSALTSETLTTLMAQEAVVAAEEISHNLWNAIGVAPSLMNTPAATTPRFEALQGQRYLRHSINTAVDCRDAFKRALLSQAAKLLRLSRSQRTNPTYSTSSPRDGPTHAGGEPPKGLQSFVSSSPLTQFDTTAPFRMSRATRSFNQARAACMNTPESDRNDTADAILSGRKALRLTSAEETTEWSVTSDLLHHPHTHKAHSNDSQRPIRVSILKNCRASFLFGPHLFLVASLQFSTIWNSEPYSPFSDMETLLQDVESYRKLVLDAVADLSLQYLAEGGATPNPEIIESAFLTCKSPMRDALTPVDIEAAMIRAGVANVGDPTDSWFDLVRSLDFDNTGFMEYNEFYLLCHRLTEEQLRRLTYIALPGKMKVGDQWTEVCLDFDAWTGGLSIYSDVHSFVKAPTDRLKMKRVEGKVWDLGDVHKVIRKERPHHAPAHTLVDTSGARYDFLIEDADLITFNKMVHWIIYVTRFRQSHMLNSVDPKTLTQLSIAATRAFAS